MPLRVDKILGMKIVKEWSKRVLKNQTIIENELLRDIEFNKDLVLLNKKLPKSQYDSKDSSIQHYENDSKANKQCSNKYIVNKLLEERLTRKKKYNVKDKLKSSSVGKKFNKYINDEVEKFPIIKLLKKKVQEDVYMNQLEDPRNPMIEAIKELPRIYDGKGSVKKALEKGKRQVQDMLYNIKVPKSHTKPYSVTLLEELTTKIPSPFKMKGSLCRDLRKPLERLPHYEGEILADINRIRSIIPFGLDCKS